VAGCLLLEFNGAGDLVVIFIENRFPRRVFVTGLFFRAAKIGPVSGLVVQFCLLAG
jgi:hypothetical protein